MLFFNAYNISGSFIQEQTQLSALTLQFIIIQPWKTSDHAKRQKLCLDKLN